MRRARGRSILSLINKQPDEMVSRLKANSERLVLPSGRSVHAGRCHMGDDFDKLVGITSINWIKIVLTYSYPMP